MEFLKLLSDLRRVRVSLSDEKQSQEMLSKYLETKNYKFEREYRLSDKDIPDFFDVESGALIEMKIKISRIKHTYQQLERYAKHDKVKVIFLMTGRSSNMPAFMNDKPVYVINMSSAWL